MISSQLFILKVAEYFDFLVTEFDFELVQGKVVENIFYEQRFSDGRKVVSISYENIEDYLQIIVYLLENGLLPDVDDGIRTLHLKQLNSVIFPLVSRDELEAKREEFGRFNASGKIENDLLKGAMELSLCLKHFPSLLFE